MKTFPHQFVDLNRLTKALQTASNIIDAGSDFGRDDVFGPELARSAVYTFRQGGDIEEKLKEEALKPRASRGTETAAREMRRFFILAGFIGYDQNSDSLSLTKSGMDLLSADNEAVKRALWREAMLTLSLIDLEGNRSHPYRILLRLVNDNPGIENFKLMLAFESRDDSEEEYKRITALLDLDFEDLIRAIDVGESNAKNAVKVLPGIADQVGDIHRRLGKSYPTASIEIAEDGIEPLTRRTKHKKSAPASGKRITKVVTSANIAVNPNFSWEDSEESIVDLSSAIELRQRRTKLHQEVVQRFAKILEDDGRMLFEDPFDCLATKGDDALLVEVKTLDGSPSDERRQSEKALGQIKGYAHFDLPDGMDRAAVTQVILFSQKPNDSTLQFLLENKVVPIWLTEDGRFELSGGDGVVVGFDVDSLL